MTVLTPNPHKTHHPTGLPTPTGPPHRKLLLPRLPPPHPVVDTAPPTTDSPCFVSLFFLLTYFFFTRTTIYSLCLSLSLSSWFSSETHLVFFVQPIWFDPFPMTRSSVRRSCRPTTFQASILLSVDHSFDRPYRHSIFLTCPSLSLSSDAVSCN